jgi:hypothetical protein
MASTRDRVHDRVMPEANCSVTSGPDLAAELRGPLMVWRRLGGGHAVAVPAIVVPVGTAMAIDPAR